MNLLVTGALPLTTEDQKALERLGYTVTVHPNEQEEVSTPERYEAVVCNGLFLHQDEQAFSSLRLVQLTSAGMDRVPLSKLRERGVSVCNARGVYSVPMAEFALFGVLSLYKESRFFQRNQQEKRWEKHRGLRELNGRTVLIVGCGSVGLACAERFFAMGCHVQGVDVVPVQSDVLETVWPLSDLDAALRLADVVVLTVPLTEQTRGLMQTPQFSAMKRDAILVNLARGAVVDETALLEALRTETIGGAVLDVFTEEPLRSDSPLWEREDVILTPHNSFVSDQNHRRLMETVLCNLEKGIR